MSILYTWANLPSTTKIPLYQPQRKIAVTQFNKVNTFLSVKTEFYMNLLHVY